MAESIEGLDSLNRTLGEAIAGLSRTGGALAEIGMLMVSEMRTNFEVGGRPEKWKPSRRSLKKGGQTLRDSGALMNSLGFEVAAGSVEVGTNLPYAAIHHFGGEIRRAAHSEIFTRNRIKRGERKGQFRRGTSSGKGFTFGEYVVKMPARPFVVISPETERTFAQIILDDLEAN